MDPFNEQTVGTTLTRSLVPCVPTPTGDTDSRQNETPLVGLSPGCIRNTAEITHIIGKETPDRKISRIPFVGP